MGIHSEFMKRVNQLPAQGLGLSVDVYQPDLAELIETLATRRLNVGYLEVFKATEKAIEQVRSRLPSTRLTYHGEGLWVTQPDFACVPSVEEELTTATTHLRTLASPWMTVECASKQMAGYSFGTYLPPLYTRESAAVTAENARTVQCYLDRVLGQGGLPGSLLLLEIPPLTYFGVGTSPIPTFFTWITDQASCGLVLDIGHLWTVYRYTDAWRQQSLKTFVDGFLNDFPMERVVEIHLAGLAEWGRQPEEPEDLRDSQETVQAGEPQDVPPRWIDAHGAPIPMVLFNLLGQVLDNPRLTNLKGIALEVDTKPIPRTVQEFTRLCDRFGQVWQRREQAPIKPKQSAAGRSESEASREANEDVRCALRRDYERYAKMASGRLDPHASGLLHPSWSYEDLGEYQAVYLPHEILHWGGELRDMFPESCRAVEEKGVNLSDFVSDWFREPRPVTVPYDFFLLKVERFVRFIADRVPMILPLAEREALDLRRAYAMANEGNFPATEVKA